MILFETSVQSTFMHFQNDKTFRCKLFIEKFESSLLFCLTKKVFLGLAEYQIKIYIKVKTETGTFFSVRVSEPWMAERVEGRQRSHPRNVGDRPQQKTQHRWRHQEQVDRCKNLTASIFCSCSDVFQNFPILLRYKTNYLGF
jgi:hypothetical protein